ncbi:hypothetical protein N9040_09695, partial [Akkermansiaceae bacterium]|nr:hypothetical protein [Akkermansiaceae bacterium]MDB4480623.1 hypothetical protein [Akkermansiaceae bacterium]
LTPTSFATSIELTSLYLIDFKLPPRHLKLPTPVQIRLQSKPTLSDTKPTSSTHEGLSRAFFSAL